MRSGVVAKGKARISKRVILISVGIISIVLGGAIRGWYATERGIADVVAMDISL